MKIGTIWSRLTSPFWLWQVCSHSPESFDAFLLPRICPSYGRRFPPAFIFEKDSPYGLPGFSCIRFTLTQ